MLPTNRLVCGVLCLGNIYGNIRMDTRYVTMHTYGDFIVLSHWDIRSTGTMTCYPTPYHYPDTEPITPCRILIMPNARLGSDKYEFSSHWFDSTRAKTCRVVIRTRKVQIPQSSSMGGGCSTHWATPSGVPVSLCTYRRKPNDVLLPWVC